MKPQSPCQFCEERKENGICHSYCERYLDYVDLNEAEKEKIRKAKEQLKHKIYMSEPEYRRAMKRKVENKVFKQHRK